MEIEQQGQPATEQIQQPLSDAQIMSRFIDPPAQVPRDETGKFSKPTEQPFEQASEQAAEATAADAAQEATAEQPAAEDAYKWDEVKSIKLKVPMKVGEKEWEDEVTLEDLRNGRMLQSDYTRKTQELAEQRKQAETLAAQAVEKERQQYVQTLNVLSKSIQQAAAPELANVDWGKLANDDPAAYVRLQNRAREVGESIQRIRFEQEKVQKVQDQERQQAMVKAVDESRQKLQSAIPNWNDDLYQSLLKRAVSTYSFNPQEVGQIWDHRFIQILHDADQFRALKDKTPETTKQLKEAPKLMVPGAKTSTGQSAQATQFQKTRETLRKTGSSDVATDYFKMLLNNEKRSA